MHWQTTPVTNSAIAAEVHQPLDVHRNFAPKVTLDYEPCDRVAQPGNFGLSQVLDLCFRRNFCRRTDHPGARIANTVDRRQRNYDVLVQRNIYACYSSHF
jgi:hypothetical protein